MSYQHLLGYLWDPNNNFYYGIFTFLPFSIMSTNDNGFSFIFEINSTFYNHIQEPFSIYYRFLDKTVKDYRLPNTVYSKIIASDIYSLDQLFKNASNSNEQFNIFFKCDMNYEQYLIHDDSQESNYKIIDFSDDTSKIISSSIIVPNNKILQLFVSIPFQFKQDSLLSFGHFSIKKINNEQGSSETDEPEIKIFGNLASLFNIIEGELRII